MEDHREPEPPEGAFDSRRRPPWTGFLPNKVARQILGMDHGPHLDPLKRVLLSVEEDDLATATAIREQFVVKFRDLQKARFDHEKNSQDLPEALWQDLQETFHSIQFAAERKIADTWSGRVDGAFTQADIDARINDAWKKMEIFTERLKKELVRYQTFVSQAVTVASDLYQVLNRLAPACRPAGPIRIRKRKEGPSRHPRGASFARMALAGQTFAIARKPVKTRAFRNWRVSQRALRGIRKLRAAARVPRSVKRKRGISAERREQERVQIRGGWKRI